MDEVNEYTLDDAWLIQQQGFVCGVCQEPFRGQPFVHKHRDGWDAGVLCSPCAKGLINLGFNKDLLQKGIDYLDGLER